MAFKKILKLSSFLVCLFLLLGCNENLSLNGPPPTNYPYFEVTEPLVVKHLVVPKGSKLIYEEHFFKEGKQDKIMNEKNLKTIELPIGETIDWGGVPVTSISKYFNTKMHGYSVIADFNELSDSKKTKFSELWQSCNDELGIDVKNTDDWSFNTENISDIQSCSVSYQRYFKEDAKQQQFLDELYAELMNIDSN